MTGVVTVEDGRLRKHDGEGAAEGEGGEGGRGEGGEGEGGVGSSRGEGGGDGGGREGAGRGEVVRAGTDWAVAMAVAGQGGAATEGALTVVLAMVALVTEGVMVVVV